jgi:N-acetylglucosamine-6-sulfatase
MPDAGSKSVVPLPSPPRLAVIVLVLLAAGVALALSSSSDEPSADPQPERPNVVLIMLDDQDAWSPRVMPKLASELAGRGVTFERFFATLPLCCPSRATMLTGQYAHNHGIWSNDADGMGFEDPTDLPIALQGAGYRTAWVGKYLNEYGRTPETKHEIPTGWDRWSASVEASDGSAWAAKWDSAFHRMFGFQLNHNGRIHRYEGRPREYQTDVLARLAAGEIRKSARRQEPFFTVLSLLAPHNETSSQIGPPNPRPAPRHEGRFQDRRFRAAPSFNESDVRDKPRFLRNPPINREASFDLQTNFRSRLGSLLSVDDAVHRILRTLVRAGELGNTYVLYTSDNGFMQGEHRLRGKGELYEESVRVPLIVRGPDVPRGEVRTQVVGNIDLAPTILQIAGIDDPVRNLDGESLLPYLRSARHRTDRGILLENPDSEGIRTRRYVYIEHHPDGGGIGYELYDLRHDPYQLQNLLGPDDTSTRENLPAGVDADGVPEVRARLKTGLDRLRDCKGQAQCAWSFPAGSGGR